MPKSQKPRKPMGPRSWEREERRAKAVEVPVHKPAMAPPTKSSLLWRHKGKFALGTGTTAAATYAYTHRQSAKKEPIMKYHDPFEVEKFSLKPLVNGVKDIVKPLEHIPSSTRNAYKPGRDVFGDLHTESSLNPMKTKLVRPKRFSKSAGLVLKSNGPGLPAFSSHAFANQPVRRVVALVPTGKHVSHANDLKVVHGKNTTTKTHSPLRRFTS